MNRAYTLRRENVLDAIREAGWFVDMGKDLPRGGSAGEGELRVLTGDWVPRWGPVPYNREPSPIIRLTFRVLSSGVANRIQAKCPECGKWMRFCGLQQHVGTRTCRKAQ